MLDFISSIFKPLTETIDNVHTSDEERMKLQNELAQIQNTTEEKVAELQAKLIEASSKVAVAETKSDSVFTRTYRPAIITGMFILICLNSFGILSNPIPDIFHSVFGAAFGVVGLGRTFEKIKRIGK